MSRLTDRFVEPSSTFTTQGSEKFRRVLQVSDKEEVKLYRVVLPNSDTLPKVRDSKFKHFKDDVGMLRTEISHHSKAETISKLTYHSQLLKN